MKNLAFYHVVKIEFLKNKELFKKSFYNLFNITHLNNLAIPDLDIYPCKVMHVSAVIKKVESFFNKNNDEKRN